ncbi:MAG: hypothetical protein J6B89_03575 [Bacilli bacterium]|nr:hypothetical protein [Bacilli bacterium]
MSKYKVQIFSTMIEPEIIEANDSFEASEEMFNMIMDNIDFYLEIVVEKIEENE